MIKPSKAVLNKDARGTAGTGAGNEELDLTANAITVLENRYLNRDAEGKIIETPTELFRRVARTLASVEEGWGVSPEARQEIEQAFYRLMVDRRFMPNSPTLMNAGRRLGMLSACFVLPLDDSIPDIMETARQIALVQRAGGGTGVDLSQLRPRGAIVASSGGTTDGPLSFLKMLSGVTDAIQQGAFRRGANMGMMRIDHPDIVHFIDIKSDLTQVTNYNLSVSMTDKFMDTFKKEPESAHMVRNPQTGATGYLRKADNNVEYGAELTDENRGNYVTVQEMWDRIVKRAWDTGEPGLIFIDEINRHNQTPNAFEMRATNPCGEQPLGPYEACNLGSVNLDHFYKENVRGGVNERIDWDALKTTVRTSVRFLDNVVEANNYPTPEIDAACRANRKIGLGVMGWADLLFHLGIRYDSDEALNLARKLGSFIQKTAWEMSSELTEQRGVFPNWKGSTWDTKHGLKMRNAHTVTIAPTGTISIIAGCSGGIEPIFSLAFTRQVLDGKTLHEVNPIFREVLEEEFDDKEVIEEIIHHAATSGTVQDLDKLPEHLRGVFRTARDVDAEWHVRMQAAWQENTDAAVSKTINLPPEADTADVEAAYQLAYDLKCKGITVYRDGSRPIQPMTLKGKEGAAGTGGAQEPDPTKPVRPVRLPEIMPCVRVRQFTPFGNMHVKISVEPDTGFEREVFAQLGKGGDLANSDLEAICRILSLFLRCNGELSLAIGQLGGIGSSLSVPSKDGRIMSLADGLAHALRKYLLVKEQSGLRALLLGEVDMNNLAPAMPQPAVDLGGGPDKETLFKVKCPECSGNLAFEEGCVKCHGCGFSQC